MRACRLLKIRKTLKIIGPYCDLRKGLDSQHGIRQDCAVDAALPDRENDPVIRLTQAHAEHLRGRSIAQPMKMTLLISSIIFTAVGWYFASRDLSVYTSTKDVLEQCIAWGSLDPGLVMSVVVGDKYLRRCRQGLLTRWRAMARHALAILPTPLIPILIIFLASGLGRLFSLYLFFGNSGFAVIAMPLFMPLIVACASVLFCLALIFQV